MSSADHSSKRLASAPKGASEGHGLAALRSRSFRWYWFGGLCSDIGNWTQATVVPFGSFRRH